MRFPDRHPDPARGGFTLIEVVVALSLSAMLLLGARALFEQLGGHAEAMVEAAAAADHDANGDAVVRSLVGAAETSPDPARPFDGTADGARFHSWCESPAGWLERCHVTLGFVHAGEAPVLAVATDGGAPIALRRGFREGRLIYLRDAANGGAWTRGWSSTVQPPLAVGVVIDGDTAILRIGERG
jgi:prepilin-type N-terminal cleavage/methylation domain-containing protein